MRIKELKENTTAGSIASVAQPMGSTQSRSKSIFKGKKTKKKFYEGKMKDIAYDLEHLDNANFKKKYNKTKDEVKASLKESTVSEAELSEQDLILVPGQMKGKDNSFIPHEKDRRDHEVEMARKELYAAAKDAMRIMKQIQNRSEDEGLMGWQQSYITLASDYLNSVADSLESVPMKEGAGVIAGGMSNFEEGRYYNPLDQERREQDAMDQERRDFKRREMEYELRGEEEAAKRANEGPWYIRIDGKLVRDKNKDPYVFNTLEAARKAAQTMMKKDWNKGKQFTLTRTTTEGMSAAVKLQRAFDREKSKSDASRERGKEELEKARKEYDKKQGVTEEQNVELSVDQLAAVSDEALDKAYGYGRSSPGNTFGWQANLKSAEYAKKAIMAGITDIEKISDMIHKGWNVTAKAFVKNPDQFSDTEKLKASGKLEAKLAQREKLMNIEYNQLPEEEKEKDRVVARALLQALTGKQDVAEGKCPECGGPAFSEEAIAEAKDACYHKVKSRYKVWPSAYASGALVKCRKVGASNWGNKSK